MEADAVAFHLLQGSLQGQQFFVRLDHQDQGKIVFEHWDCLVMFFAVRLGKSYPIPHPIKIYMPPQHLTFIILNLPHPFLFLPNPMHILIQLVPINFTNLPIHISNGHRILFFIFGHHTSKEIYTIEVLWYNFYYYPHCIGCWGILLLREGLKFYLMDLPEELAWSDAYVYLF